MGPANGSASEQLIIGDISVPAYYGSPTSSTMFYEIYSDVPSCAQMPPAVVHFE